MKLDFTEKKTSNILHSLKDICFMLEKRFKPPSTSVVVPYCSCCLCLYFGSAIMLVTYFVNFR